MWIDAALTSPDILSGDLPPQRYQLLSTLARQKGTIPPDLGGPWGRFQVDFKMWALLALLLLLLDPFS